MMIVKAMMIIQTMPMTRKRYQKAKRCILPPRVQVHRHAFISRRWEYLGRVTGHDGDVHYGREGAGERQLQLREAVRA
jgi:hypothetical protein